MAADYLLQRGYDLLERNVRTPYGELDLVMR
jgi:Holliday junction resolvase-like predicted endonuclease